jgi:hypothetical protein
MEIGVWLRSLGLERYEPAFRENEIDWEALPKLTAEDLKDLGVVLGGHRRRLLDAIAILSGAETPPAVTPAPVVIGGEAERRQLTVMFCDLVGSTPLSARFDPEDLREIVGAYHRCVADTVARFGGFVAKYMGDGVLIYFGYPEAHEDDAERAARAGLAVINAVGRLTTQEPLNHPTSRELLDLTVEKIKGLPVLLVATYRPEFQPPWVGQSQVMVIALNRLGRSEGATLVRQLAGNLASLPSDIVDEIVERTDGVPLFVEELTKAVVEAGADRGNVSIATVPPSSLCYAPAILST